MNNYLQVLKKYAEFKGRSSRKEYWYFQIIQLLIIIFLVYWDSRLNMLDLEAGFGTLSGLYIVATLVPSLAVTVRRLHDISRSGWWFFISLVPLVGPIILLVMMLMAGEPAKNEYGPAQRD